MSLDCDSFTSSKTAPTDARFDFFRSPRESPVYRRCFYSSGIVKGYETIVNYGFPAIAPTGGT